MDPLKCVNRKSAGYSMAILNPHGFQKNGTSFVFVHSLRDKQPMRCDGQLAKRANKLGQTDLVCGWWSEFCTCRITRLYVQRLWFAPPRLTHTDKIYKHRELLTGYTI